MSDKSSDDQILSKKQKQHQIRINKILKRREAVKKELKELYRAKEPDWDLISQKQKEYLSLVFSKRFVSEYLRD